LSAPIAHRRFAASAADQPTSRRARPSHLEASRPTSIAYPALNTRRAE
jgi:hypothetical protein